MPDPSTSASESAGATIDSKAAGIGSPTGGGMYRAHDLERHVNTYTLTDSDLDLMEGSGPLFDFCLALALFFGSVAITCYLSGVTVPHTQWTAQQFALFYYVPLGSIVIFLASTLLTVMIGVRRSSARKRIKKESFVPGTYVPETRR